VIAIMTALFYTPRHVKAQLVELNKLLEHEECDQFHLEELIKEIATDRILKLAIVADKDTNIILDGEHRFNALKKLGCKKIPVIYIDYNSPNIEVQTWRNDIYLTKKGVIKAGLGKKKFPPITSKHVVKDSKGVSHISSIEKKVDIPLEILKDEAMLTHVD